MSGEKPIGERVATVEANLTKLEKWVSEIDGIVTLHEATFNKVWGGWILLCLLCGGSGAIGALIIKFVTS